MSIIGHPGLTFAGRCPQVRDNQSPSGQRPNAVSIEGMFGGGLSGLVRKE